GPAHLTSLLVWAVLGLVPLARVKKGTATAQERSFNPSQSLPALPPPPLKHKNDALFPLPRVTVRPRHQQSKDPYAIPADPTTDHGVSEHGQIQGKPVRGHPTTRRCAP